MKEEAKKNQPPPPKFERDPDLISEYANSARFESTVYDLKIIFGQTDLASGSEIIRQHTAITIPWSLVKIALYYLQVNLIVHEGNNGKVTIPPSQIPQPLAEEPPAEVATDPIARKTFEDVRQFRKQFLEEFL
jgi:hypothetical protein